MPSDWPTEAQCATVRVRLQHITACCTDVFLGLAWSRADDSWSSDASSSETRRCVSAASAQLPRRPSRVCTAARVSGRAQVGRQFCRLHLRTQEGLGRTVEGGEAQVQRTCRVCQNIPPCARVEGKRSTYSTNPETPHDEDFDRVLRRHSLRGSVNVCLMTIARGRVCCRRHAPRWPGRMDIDLGENAERTNSPSDSHGPSDSVGRRGNPSHPVAPLYWMKTPRA